MPNFALVTTLFVGVNLDFFIVLLVLLQKYKFKDTLLGYELGMLIILMVSALAGQFIQSIVPDWSIGFLGLVPIFFGIKGEGDADEEMHAKSKIGILSVMLMYVVSCGADNIAAYLPVLATMQTHAVFITAIYFVILTFISISIAYFFGKLPIIKKVFNTCGETLTRLIYIAIGIFVMIDTGLISHFIH
ncbi:cadmium resistance transporter [Apilactobacillus sp. M161]|uniref:Cadmium resistance transporter n=1 Tax=Apilactobacillus xinyiensis TaxID=2841032 RepID=A0ABT0I264_9LACO|nr:cadmium resistance transporter [Apilactobacillus xinyiensis]MCK8624815.1 cadmium resistance transporter [Apilactobacillus xinyiensis]